jgi:hypothetical protein
VCGVLAVGQGKIGVDGLAMLFETALCTEKSIAVLTLKATFGHLVLFKGIVIA